MLFISSRDTRKFQDVSPVVDVVVSGREKVEEELITNGTSDFLVTAERSENRKLTTDN